MEELQILYLEDSVHDAEMTARALRKAGFRFSFKLVDKQDEYESALKEFKPDLVLADHSLFQFNSVEALRIFKGYNYSVPFILVTGTVSEEFAVNILKEGADDYLLKDNLARLPNAVINALEKCKMERELREHIDNIIANEARLKEAEHLAKIGSWQVDLSTQKVMWSDEVYRIYGYQPGEIEPSFENFIKHVHADEVDLLKKKIEDGISDADSYQTEFRIVDKTGQIKHLNFKFVVNRDENRMPVRFSGFVHDITERKVAEEKLYETFNEVAKLEKQLSEQRLHQQKIITEVTIQAQEKERDELAKELHDNINQVLTTIKMYLSIAISDDGARKELVEKCHGHIVYAIEEIRKLSKSLLTPSLGDMGLETALMDLAEQINVGDGPLVVVNNKIPKTLYLDVKLELMIYRIVQEQLNNIIKYAKASEAIIKLRAGSKNICLSIIDNGVGFDPSKQAKGIGLKNIRSRVEFYSGTLKINSSPGNGCTMEISIPIIS